MELLGILALLLVLALPVSLVVLFVGQGGLKARAQRLEEQVARLRDEIDDLRAAAARAATPLPPQAAVTTPPVVATEAPPTPPAEPEPAPSDTAPPQPADSPWQRVQAPSVIPAAVTPPGDPTQNRPLVLGADPFARLGVWLRDNWVYAISGVSLALAGIFLVQWGMERGLLPPGIRVMLGLGFGATLIAAGDYIRRRHGDGPEVATAYLPSVFSGAGLVAIFAAILAARQLYGLIGPGPAFAGLIAAALLGVVLGWFHGPLLAALGLIGGTVAPFAVGGASQDPSYLHLYFLLIAAIGLAVDAVRRWAWISVLALFLSYIAGWLLTLGTGPTVLWLVQLAVLPVIATALPVLQVWPRHDGVTVTERLLNLTRGEWPQFPARLAMGSMLASSGFLVVMPAATVAEDVLIYAALAALTLAALLWAAGARGLQDLAAIPALGFLIRLVEATGAQRGVFATIRFATDTDTTPLPPSMDGVLAVLGLSALISAAFALRSLRAPAQGFGLAWAFGAVTVAPLSMVAVELFWRPSAPHLVPYTWALLVVALAAGMTALALAYARHDGDARRRVAWAALSALSLIALALFILTTKAPLTLALAVLIAVAAGLDRRFALPEMGLYLQLGLAVLVWRLAVDPGIIWAFEAPLGQALLACLGALAGVLAALWLIGPLNRPLAKLVLESGAMGIAALTASVMLTRWLVRDGTEADLNTHWGLTLNALPWLILALSQLYRMQPGHWGNLLRALLAVLAGLVAGLAIGLSATVLNPVLGTRYEPDPVLGLPLVDTLLIAYAVPGLVLIAALQRMGHLPVTLRRGGQGIGVALLLLYAGLEIRRLWRGDDLSVPGVTQPELYSYTLALMVLGAALLWQAIARRSVLLRRVAMGVIALTVAKVFLVDGAGLTGLTRVLSFLGLGLTLAGLAWLNRWAAQAAKD